MPNKLKGNGIFLIRPVFTIFICLIIFCPVFAQHNGYIAGKQGEGIWMDFNLDNKRGGAYDFTTESYRLNENKLNALPEVTNEIPSQLDFNITAAFLGENNKIYFFNDPNEYLRFNGENYLIDPGYPKPIVSNWPGLPGKIDAAFKAENGKVYFFSGTQYYRYDWKNDRVDPGYPKSIVGNWPGLPGKIDAAFLAENEKVYFFSGTQYYRYDWDKDKVDPGYPKPIGGNWPGLPGYIDAAFKAKDKKVHFFSGNRYYRYDWDKDKVDPGYPKPIGDYWNYYAQAIKIKSIKCIKISDVLDLDVQDEIYFKWGPIDIDKKSKTATYSINPGDHMPLNFILPFNNGQDIEFTLMEYDDTSGDDVLGKNTFVRIPSGNSFVSSGEYELDFNGDGGEYKVYYQYVGLSDSTPFAKKQKYSVADIPGLFKKQLTPDRKIDLKGMGNDFYGKYSNYISTVSFLKIKENHVQGIAKTAQGRIIVSHDLSGTAGVLAYSQRNGFCDENTPFEYVKVPGNASANHPSTMQACGDYLAVAITGVGVVFYKSLDAGLVKLPATISDSSVDAVGLVYSNVENCYYVLTADVADQSEEAKLKLYRSTNENLESGLYQVGRDFKGWGSSSGTHLLIQNDGTLFILTTYSILGGLLEEAIIMSDHARLSKINNHKSQPSPETKVDWEWVRTRESQQNEAIQAIKAVLGGNLSLEDPCFRFGSFLEISNQNCYLVGSERGFSADYRLAYYKIN